MPWVSRPRSRSLTYTFRSRSRSIEVPYNKMILIIIHYNNKGISRPVISIKVAELGWRQKESFAESLNE